MTSDTPMLKEATDNLAVGFSRVEIDRVAETVADLAGLKPGGDLEPLVRRLRGEIKYQDYLEWEPEEHGSLEVGDDGRFTINLPIFISIFRNRFTIAHELGHLMLHAQMGKVGGVRFTRRKREDNARIEYEANCFAAGLLMPTTHFNRERTKTEDPYHLGAIFHVSAEAAGYRLQNLPK